MPNLVISYAREDRPIVRALVGLLRAALMNIEEAVYWDDDFEPGQPWFDQMKVQICAAGQVFVIWCGHTVQSVQVEREYLYARERRVTVVPVLIDSSPLPSELGVVHGIDLRDLRLHRLVPWGPLDPLGLSPREPGRIIIQDENDAANARADLDASAAEIAVRFDPFLRTQRSPERDT
jgi:TIR domain